MLTHHIGDLNFVYFYPCNIVSTVDHNECGIHRNYAFCTGTFAYVNDKSNRDGPTGKSIISPGHKH